MSRKKFNALLAQQMPDSEKRARADYVVDTSGTIADTHEQIDRLIESLKGRTGEAIAAWQDSPRRVSGKKSRGRRLSVRKRKKSKD